MQIPSRKVPLEYRSPQKRIPISDFGQYSTPVPRRPNFDTLDVNHPYRKKAVYRVNKVSLPPISSDVRDQDTIRLRKGRSS